MADLTEAEIQAQITAINTKLLDLVTNPKPDYTVGEHTFTWSSYHRILLDQLKIYREMAAQLSWEESTLARDW